MKKILFGLISLFFASQIFVSCSSEGEVLSQFSKRKYLKNFKEKNIKYEDNIDKYDIKVDYSSSLNEYASNNAKPMDYQLNEIETEDNSLMVEWSEEKTEQIRSIKESNINYSDWNKYNRKMDFSKMNFNNSELKKNANSMSNNSSRASEVLIAIFCVLIPFVGILIYEGNVTGNFWVGLLLTLIFWIPGIIFAFLVCFGDVSV